MTCPDCQWLAYCGRFGCYLGGEYSHIPRPIGFPASGNPLSAREVAALCAGSDPMISPYLPAKVNTHEDGEPCPSFGQDEAGYSIRPADEWSVLMPDLQHYTIDVRKEGVGPVLIEHRGPYVDIPANSMVLARSVERFHIPSDVIGLAVGKSTQARVGVVAVITPLEPDWRGYLTLEIANHAPYPNRVWAGAGITQLVFFRLSEPASYKGRYQNQPAAIVQAR